jgi:hypothetical protein
MCFLALGAAVARDAAPAAHLQFPLGSRLTRSAPTLESYQVVRLDFVKLNLIVENTGPTMSVVVVE